MPFSKFGLHPDLLRGIKELGFTRPTPIQVDAIPPAMAGKDVLAAAVTGSGKTAAFVLPILHRLIGKKRGTTRALILTPTRELAAQIDEHLRELAVHTPISGAAIYGGVGMGPQEHAFRSGVDVLVATPGRLLDHFSRGYAKLEGLEVLVLDEADRMLDMGFLPDIRRILKHLPPRRQTLFFSATLPSPTVQLSQEMLRNPAMIAIERKAAPVAALAQSVFPVSQELKTPLLETLIERALGKRLPRVTVPDFDYTRRPVENLEVPIHERIAAIRARKSDDRARAKAKVERRAAAPAPPLTRRSAPPSARFAGRGPSGVTSPSPRPRGEGGRRPDEGRPHRSRGRRRP